MATIVGGAIGYFVGGSAAVSGFFGVTSAVGAMWGARLGGLVGGWIGGPKPPTMEGPRLNDLSVQTATYGASIPRIYGTVATQGNVFWLENDKLKEVVKKKKSGGKGDGQKVKTYTYFATFAVGLCSGPIAGVRRIWVGPKLIYDAGSNDLETIVASNQAENGFRVYLGSDTQDPDPRMQADKGVGDTPAYRGLAYLVLYDYPLAEHGNSLMGAQVKVEVVKTQSIGTPTLIGSFPTMTGKVVHSEDGIVTTAEEGQKYFFTSTDGFRHYYGEVVYRQYNQSQQTRTYTIGQSVKVADMPESFTWFRTCVVHNTSNEMFVLRNAGASPMLRFNWSGAEFSHNLDTENFVKNYFKFGGIYLMPTNAGVSIFNGSSFSMVTYPNAIYGRSTNVHQNVRFSIDKATNVLYGYIRTNNTGWNDLLEIDAAGGLVRLWSFNFGSFTPYFYVWNNRLAINTNIGDAERIGVFDRVGSDWNAVGDNAQTETDMHFLGEGVALRGSQMWKISDNQTTSQAALSSIVQAETLQSKLITLSDINTTSLTDQVRGFRVAQPGAIRGAIDPLQSSWPFDIVQSGYQLKFIRRGAGSSVATISAEKLDARPRSESPGTELTLDREMDSQLPREAYLRYLDAGREYDPSEQRAERLSTEAISRTDLDLPIVLTASEASQKAETLLYLWWLERHDATFKLPPEYLGLEPADIITVTGKWGEYVLRLTSVTYLPDGRLECSAKFHSTAVYTSNAVADTGTSQGATIGLSGPNLYRLLDIPLLADDLNTPGLPVAMCGYTQAWPGGVVIRSSDGGQTWDDIQAFTDPVTIGFARGTIGAATSTLIDKSSRLQVDIVAGELESISELNLLNGQNTFAYGAHGRWEIIGAQNCVLQGDGSYILSDLLRGRFGTEQYMAVHQVGDSLILLTDPDLSFVSMTSGQIGQDKLYRGITADRDIDSDSDLSFAYEGVNLRPLSPVYLNGHRTSNDWTLSWIRRGRVSPDWRNSVDVPVGEETQSYEIEIYTTSGYTTVARTLTSTTPTVAYTSAQQVTDFGSNQSTLYVRIYQVSALVGKGYPLQTSITR